MRKWLIFILVLIVLGFGVLFWLGTKAGADKPADGEIRIEVENVL